MSMNSLKQIETAVFTLPLSIILFLLIRFDITTVETKRKLLTSNIIGKNNENWVFRGTHVSPVQALSEDGNNSNVH